MKDDAELKEYLALVEIYRNSTNDSLRSRVGAFVSA